MSSTDPGDTDIWGAAASGDTARVTALLDGGVDVDSKSKNGWSPLAMAADKGHTATVEALLAHKAGVNFHVHGRTALFHAAYNGHTAVVEVLLAAGSDVKIVPKDGWTALIHAAGEGHTAVVQCLVDAGADMTIKYQYGGTALHRAAEFGRTAVVEVLVAAGADMATKDTHGRTPLMAAAQCGYAATVQSLVAAGADMDTQGWRDGMTALHYTALGDHADVVEVLAESGANLNIADQIGRTPLIVAAFKGQTAVVQSLVAHGADMNIQAKNGFTALIMALHEEHFEAAEVLIKAGAVLNLQEESGLTALIVAAFKGHIAALQSLLSAGADMNIQDKNGCTALIVAVNEKKFEAAEVLIKAGAGLSQQEENYGWTALFCAAKVGHLPVVRLLLERGADPTHKDKDGDTPFDIAKKHSHDSVMAELEKQTASQPVAREPVVIAFKDIELKETVGKGAFGAVFKGYWTSSDGGRQLVAIKQLSKVVEKEVKLLGSLCHPNIITLYGTSENKPYTYLVTDFAANSSLHDFISERPLSPDLKRALPWAKQVAEGMLYLHSRGILHRDLKSSNVVLTSEWVAKICDLGTAREVDHTTMMTSVGTLAWMAPEIGMMQPASKLCDVYSYGIMLWEMCTHDKPFKGIPPLYIPLKVGEGVRPLIPESTDVAVKELIEKCWQTKPEDRPVFESVLYSLEECEMGKMEYEELDLGGGEPVGSGTFGDVFKGFWNTKKAGKIMVAIKRTTNMEDEKEVKVLSSLRHPNFIRYYGCVKAKPHLYIVTEFAEKGSIAGYISARKGKPERARALKWGREIAEGMSYFHEKGRSFVHRDLKSANVLLMSDWTAKICDLGTAKKLLATVRQTSVVGTYPWMAPEILMEEPASQKCDVYSYAIVLWELVTFQVPLEGHSVFQIMTTVAKGERPAIPSACDQSLSDLIQQCWADDYKVRPPFDEILKTLNKSFT